MYRENLNILYWPSMWTGLEYLCLKKNKTHNLIVNAGQGVNKKCFSRIISGLLSDWTITGTEI